MCLCPKHNLPKIAFKDIPVDKYVYYFEDKDIFVTPYMYRHVYKEMSDSFINTFLAILRCIFTGGITKGFIHSAKKGNYMQGIRLNAVIPKGSLYYEGYDAYASSKLIITDEDSRICAQT